MIDSILFERYYPHISTFRFWKRTQIYSIIDLSKSITAEFMSPFHAHSLTQCANHDLIKLKGTAKLAAQGEQVCLKDSKYILFEILENRTHTALNQLFIQLNSERLWRPWGIHTWLGELEIIEKSQK